MLTHMNPTMLARAEEIQQQIQQLSGRDLQLWSIGILVILVLTAAGCASYQTDRSPI